MRFIMVFMFLFFATSVAAKDYSSLPLDLIAPKTTFDINNRYNRAYPNLLYSVDVVIGGGNYPYAFNLIEGPAGARIHPTTGTLLWDNPQINENKYRFHVVVEDSSTTKKKMDVIWDVQVTKEGFMFVDSEKGQHTGSGSIESPKKDFSDIYGGLTYESKYSEVNKNLFIYFRNGVYKFDGYKEDARVQWTPRQPVVFMAYPGEYVEFDMKSTHLWSFGDLHNFYLEGVKINQISRPEEKNPEYHRAFRISGGSKDVVFRNNRFQNLITSKDAWNQSVIMANHGEGGEKWAIVNNYFGNILHGFGILAYTINHVAIQRNTFETFYDPEGQGTSHAVGAKRHSRFWYINENTFDDIRGNGIWLYYAKDSQINYGNIDVSYNRIDTNGSGFAITFNDKYSLIDLPSYIYRNNIIGKVRFIRVKATSPEISFQDNLIETYGGNHVTCIECDQTNILDVGNSVTSEIGGHFLDRDAVKGAISKFTFSTLIGADIVFEDENPANLSPKYKFKEKSN